MSGPIAGAYFDGRSARKHVVSVELADGVIALHGAESMATPRTYALRQARLAEAFAGAPCIVDFDDGARLEVERAGYPLLAQALRRRRSTVEFWQQHWQGALASVVLMVGAVAGIATWGVPAAAEAIVAGMPVAADRQLGDSTQALLEKRLFGPTKLSAAQVAEVKAIFEQVRPRAARMPYTLAVMRMNEDMANAIALPNGTIIMSDAMVREVLEGKASPEARRAQLAGVLAHEIGHIEGRHGMRSVARGSLMAAGSAALFGDFSMVAAGVPAMLLNMDYSRDMERAADDYAIRRLRALGMPATPLAELFEALERAEDGDDEDDGGGLAGADYFSSHPATSERSRRFRAADAAESSTR